VRSFFNSELPDLLIVSSHEKEKSPAEAGLRHWEKRQVSPDNSILQFPAGDNNHMHSAVYPLE
jgi:hypothetical protein